MFCCKVAPLAAPTRPPRRCGHMRQAVDQRPFLGALVGSVIPAPLAARGQTEVYRVGLPLQSSPLPPETPGLFVPILACLPRGSEPHLWQGLLEGSRGAGKGTGGRLDSERRERGRYSCLGARVTRHYHPASRRPTMNRRPAMEPEELLEVHHGKSSALFPEVQPVGRWGTRSRGLGSFHQRGPGSYTDALEKAEDHDEKRL